jgi:Family of unknown function (DUF6166)
MRIRMKRYVGQRSKKGRALVFVIRIDGDSRRLKLHPTLCSLSNRFEWGYEGIGPAQLAWEMLYDATGDVRIATKVHFAFMKRFVSVFRGSRSWSMSEADVLKAATLLSEEMEGKQAK